MFRYFYIEKNIYLETYMYGIFYKRLQRKGATIYWPPRGNILIQRGLGRLLLTIFYMHYKVFDFIPTLRVFYMNVFHRLEVSKGTCIYGEAWYMLLVYWEYSWNYIQKLLFPVLRKFNQYYTLIKNFWECHDRDGIK